MHQNKQHIPVLLTQVLQYLNPTSGESYLDVTAGYGGHAKAILERTNSPGSTILVDRDIEAIESLEQQFAKTGVEIRHQDFYSASRELVNQGRLFDLILADLGVSSPHLNEASRGFAIDHTGPLDMRMDQEQSLTADTIVNSFSEAALSELLKKYGEEPKAHTIARLIIKHRPLHSTTELATIVAHAWPGHSRVHPATRTFQALRIAVNDELSLLEQSLPLWIALLAPGGRIGVISFHSLEDRLVKQSFAQVSGNRYDAVLELLTKHPVSGDKDDLVFNPRARSAKLRVAVKINNRKGSTNAYSGKE